MTDFIKILKDLHEDTKWTKNPIKKFFVMDKNANSNFGEIVNVKKKILGREFKNESFAEASERMRLTEADQKDAFDYHKNLFIVWSGLGILATVVLLTVPFNHHYLACLPSLAFMAVAIAQCYQASYRCYCINHRSLAGIKAWKKSGEWKPRPFKFKDKTQKALSLSRGGRRIKGR